jgi:hypothetical protein
VGVGELLALALIPHLCPRRSSTDAGTPPPATHVRRCADDGVGTGKLLHLLSDRGARRHFVDHYWPGVVVPILQAAAAHGERLVSVVVLLADECVHWDPADPPPSGDDVKKSASF